MMRSTRRSRQFHPPLWAILAYALVLTLMLLLGRWQLLRADEKRQMQQAAELARQATAVELSTLETNALDVMASTYARVSLSGPWLDDRQFLWDNRSHQGRAGFEVIAPVELVDGRLALVNRGWIAPGPNRRELPDVSLPDADLTSLPIVGLLSQPSRGFAKGEAFDESGDWPQVLQYFDYPAMERALGAPLLPGVVQVLDASETQQSVDLSEPWLTPNWQPTASGPAKHYSYAFQWFAMAIALSVLFVVTNLKRALGEQDGEEPMNPAETTESARDSE